ncbi:MAG TPA: hypothetical protein VGH01_12225 [Jatrophihabitantaceae bacterium]
MLSLVLYGLLAVGLMVVLFFVAARFLPAGEQIAPALRDEPPWALPAERHLKADDIEDLRLPVALRGFRFAETDELLDRVVAELRRRDDELERLYGLLITMPVPSAELHETVPPQAAPGPVDAAAGDVENVPAPAEAEAAEAEPAEGDAAEAQSGAQPAAEQSAAEQSAAEQSAAEQPAAEQPAQTEQPAQMEQPAEAEQPPPDAEAEAGQAQPGA